MVSDINAAITILYGLPTPTVAAVNGHAIGAGFVVMLACDARLATDADTKLGLTEVTAGIPYPACPMEVVNAEIEPSWRRHLVLSGEIISSHAAQVRGLLDDVVAHQELLDRAVELARLRAAAPSYPQVKDQLKHDTRCVRSSRPRAIPCLSTGSDQARFRNPAQDRGMAKELPTTQHARSLTWGGRIAPARLWRGCRPPGGRALLSTRGQQARSGPSRRVPEIRRCSWVRIPQGRPRHSWSPLPQPCVWSPPCDDEGSRHCATR
jgi:hypothetical protein